MPSFWSFSKSYIEYVVHAYVRTYIHTFQFYEIDQVNSSWNRSSRYFTNRFLHDYRCLQVLSEQLPSPVPPNSKTTTMKMMKKMMMEMKMRGRMSRRIGGPVAGGGPRAGGCRCRAPRCRRRSCSRSTEPCGR